jgi:hypothetical protein
MDSNYVDYGNSSKPACLQDNHGYIHTSLLFFDVYCLLTRGLDRDQLVTLMNQAPH